MTPRLVSLKYSKGLDLLVVFRNGYKYRGMCAEEKSKRKESLKEYNIPYELSLTTKNQWIFWHPSSLLIFNIKRKGIIPSNFEKLLV